MLGRFVAQLDATGLIPPGAKVLVAYSGGADSTCLLHLSKRAGLDVVAAHLHHGMRAEADEELELCARFCKDLDVSFASGRADVPAIGRALGVGIEEAGRHARYEFLQASMHHLGCTLIATGHTRTDQIETVLLNLVRGSGLAGLRGVPLRRGVIVRPLLGFSRVETRAYCTDLGLWTHDDPANIDLANSRSRLRLRVAPELALINPAFEANIARFAEVAGEEDDFLNALAASALERAELPLNGPLRFLTAEVESAFDREPLLHTQPVLRKRGYRLVASALGASLDWNAVRRIDDGVQGGAKGAVTTEGGGVVVEWSPSRLHFCEATPTAPAEASLGLDGTFDSQTLGFRFQVGKRQEARDEEPPRNALTAIFDSSGIYEPLVYRPAEPGEKMQPRGFAGTRALSDLMSEAKLTKACRARLPVVCDKNGPIWVPGVCVTERSRPTYDTKETLHLRFSALG